MALMVRSYERNYFQVTCLEREWVNVLDSKNPLPV